MELLILLGLLGAVGLFALFSNNGDEEEDDGSAQDPNGDENDNPLIGGGNNDSLSGRGGNDTVEGFGGADTLFGGDGDDTVVGGRGGDLMYGGNGDDKIQEDWYLVSNPDEMDDGNDTIFGGAGNDFLRGLRGDDSIDGGVDDDTIWADDGNDTLNGGIGNDDLSAGNGNDQLDGGHGDDLLEGGGGMDTLFGRGGDDVLDGIAPAHSAPGPNTSILNGGDGNDTLSFQDGSTVRGGAGDDQFWMVDTLHDDLVSRIEDFDPDADRLAIQIAAGNGHSGGFSLVARADGLGRDLFLGDDLVAEIMGSKPFEVSDLSIRVLLTPASGGSEESIQYTIGPDDMEAGVSVIGGIADDHIIGTDGDDLISLRIGVSVSGNDMAEGGGGNDTLSGHGGYIYEYGGDDGDESRIFVSVETDTLLGGDGDDDLISHYGNVMTGGDGSDVFIASTRTTEADDGTVLPAAVITDFDPAEDVLVLGQVDGIWPTPSDITLRVLGDGTGSEVLVRGIVVARVIGGQGLALADIQIEDRNGATDYRAA